MLIRPFIGLLISALVLSVHGEERSTLYRKSVENSLVSPGWHLAAPTGGNFSVALPCPFNDFSTDGADPKYPVSASRSVACRLGERIQITASQFHYRSEADARAQFEKVLSASRGMLLKQLPPGYGDRPTFEFDGSLANLDSRSRAILTGNKIVMLVVEWRPSALPEAQRLFPEFFSSLRVEN